ncbi:phosphate regulon sensor histidine kinase PhoR [Aquabacterium sp.]|uniref:phosphate regulon sensor histidine kinase PhoR n=1 Tax=Aquabacterium sp. TaxID=1872578 RepID=UPI0035AE6F79
MKWNVSRVVAGVFALVAGSALGWMAGRQMPNPLLPALIGASVGVLLIALADTWHGYRLLEWLRLGTDSAAPSDTGMWGEIAHRVERALRLRENQAEHERERLSEFFEAIEASPNGVLLMDANDQIDWFSSVAADHFGLQPERDLRQRITNLVRSPAFVSYLQAGNFDMPVKFVNPQGQGMLSVMIREYGDGQKLVLTQDITERERAETMRRDFVANVSHEIRTPLTVLSGFIETLANLPLTEVERKRVLSLMSQQTGRMQALVSDLLTLAQLEGSPRPALDRWVPVARLLAHVESDARSLSHGRHHLSFTPAAGDVPTAAQIAGSETELLSALANLVNNAIRYTPEGGHVDVRWRVTPDGEGEFQVRDTGAGIEAEHLPRLTERFYRVDGSRSRDTGGTGLGLSIVKHVVQRHAGELHIESQVGQGSCFTLVFPPARVRASIEDARKGESPAA